MGFSFNFGYNSAPIQSIEIDRSGNYFYTLFSSQANHNKFVDDSAKLKAVLSNPYLLKCFTLNADIFSIGRIDSGEKQDYLPTVKQDPNHRQSWSQFMWDYMFYIQLGTAYLWKPYAANNLNDTYPIQFLNPANFDWSNSLLDKLKDLILSKGSLKELKKQKVKYKFGNGESKRIPLEEITPLFDLTNSTGNLYQGASRLDALYKIISNTEQALDAKSKNLEYSRKFVVNGNNEITNVSELPMSSDEKQSIEGIMNSKKDVHAVKTPININRFVDDIASLKIDESLNSDYLTIGTAYGIPKELLDVNIGGKNGSTYENQQKAIGRHVEYTLQPKAKNLMEQMERLFGLKDLVMTWEHCSFNQVFEGEKQANIKLKLENAILAKQNDLNLEDYEY